MDAVVPPCQVALLGVHTPIGLLEFVEDPQHFGVVSHQRVAGVSY